MTTINAWAADEKAGAFKPFTYEAADLKPDDVEIDVKHCGICHSDLSMLDNAWGMTKYPFVGGHEVSGTVAAVGEAVKHIKPGDQVGLGWHAGYCTVCDQCLSGHHNRCPKADETIVGRHGGFADKVRAKGVSVFKIPDGLDAAEVGPMLCGGITVFNPFMVHNLSPTASVGVLGIGGLGHMAIKFASAWGCHVTALTSESKFEQAKDMGAHDVLDSRDESKLKKAGNRFDLLLSTVNVDMNWDACINTLKPGGILHNVGAVMNPIAVTAFPMILGEKSLAASPVGPPARIRKMLEFAARHDILPTTEHFKFDQINDAFEHLRSGKARYRIVLDR